MLPAKLSIETSILNINNNIFSVSARENKLSCCPHSFKKRVSGRYSPAFLHTRILEKEDFSTRAWKIKSRRRDNFRFFFLELYKLYFYSTCFQRVCYFLFLARQYIKVFYSANKFNKSTGYFLLYTYCDILTEKLFRTFSNGMSCPFNDIVRNFA